MLGEVVQLHLILRKQHFDLGRQSTSVAICMYYVRGQHQIRQNSFMIW